YEREAPESFPILPRTPDSPGLSRPLMRFEITGPHPEKVPAISHVAIVHLTNAKLPDLLACDMVTGELLIHRLGGSSESCAVLASDLAHPAHAEVVDLDQDGLKDILVADLGTPLPSDERLGRVLWLRRTNHGGYKMRTIISGLGRVCDVKAADFDEDGDL